MPIRGYISPMPVPATTHAMPMSQGVSSRAAVASTRPMPVTSSSAPVRSAVTLASRAPSRACTWDAPAQPSAPTVSEAPDSQTARSYCSCSR